MTSEFYRRTKNKRVLGFQLISPPWGVVELKGTNTKHGFRDGELIIGSTAMAVGGVAGVSGVEFLSAGGPHEPRITTVEWVLGRGEYEFR